MMTKLATPAIALFSFLLLFGSGCSEEDVGVPCCLKGRDPAGACIPPEKTATVTINAQALDCRSRLCIRYGAHEKENAKSLCTSPCESADDCPESGPTCSEGFACVYGQTVEGGLQCCKLCVCKSDVLIDENGQVIDSQAKTCANKTSMCPNI